MWILSALRLQTFSSALPFGDYKYVLLDEADYITPNGQAALRGVMETYHASCRFILTCKLSQQSYPSVTQQMPGLPHREVGCH